MSQPDYTALTAFREVCAGESLTPERIRALEGLTPQMLESAEVERLKQFARDTAAINPNLLGDIDSGTVRPCRALTECMDAFYADQPRDAVQMSLELEAA